MIEFTEINSLSKQELLMRGNGLVPSEMVRVFKSGRIPPIPSSVIMKPNKRVVNTKAPGKRDYPTAQENTLIPLEIFTSETGKMGKNMGMGTLFSGTK